MKKMVSLILAVIFLCITSGFAETYMESFTVRNGISFGLTLDEVKKIEKNTGPLTKDGDYWKIENITISGISNSTVYYGFDSNQRLYEFHYNYNTPRTSYAFCEREYLRITQSLINKYGEPLGYSGGKTHVIRTATLDSLIESLRTIELFFPIAVPSTYYLPYNEWVIDTNDGHIKIEHVMIYIGNSSGESTPHILKYQFYSNEEWDKLLNNYADDI